MHTTIDRLRSFTAGIPAGGRHWILGLALAGLVGFVPASAVRAQVGPAAAASPAAPGKHRLQHRFDAANTTHDGHLTLSQAQQGGWRMVANHFDDIDIGHKGYVSLDDVRAYARARRATRREHAGGVQTEPQQQP